MVVDPDLLSLHHRLHTLCEVGVSEYELQQAKPLARVLPLLKT